MKDPSLDRDAVRPVTLDQPTREESVQHARVSLDALATDLRCLWASALEDGDFDEITRLAEATQAVHCAVIALRPDPEVITPVIL